MSILIMVCELGAPPAARHARSGMPEKTPSRPAGHGGDEPEINSMIYHCNGRLQPPPDERLSRSLRRQRQLAEARVVELNQRAEDLLDQIEGADAMTAEILRAEATRLYSTAFEITAALARGDVPTAYRLSLIDADHARGARVA